METFAIWKDLTLVLHKKFVSTYLKKKKKINLYVMLHILRVGKYKGKSNTSLRRCQLY